MEEIVLRKRDFSERSPEETPEAKRMKAANLILLDMLEETESSDPAAGDLDSVLKSFEEEIRVTSAAAEEEPLASTSAVSDSADVLQADLSYLLEASDDELGIPPAVLSSSDGGESPLAEFRRFDVDFESFGHDGGEVTAGAYLFEYDEFDNPWRSEFLPAV